MSKWLTIVQLLPSDERKVWCFGHHDVYALVEQLLIPLRGDVEKAVSMLPLRVTAAIWSYTLPPSEEIKDTGYFRLIESHELPDGNESTSPEVERK